MSSLNMLYKKVLEELFAYAEAIGWSVVSREEAEERRGGIQRRADRCASKQA